MSAVRTDAEQLEGLRRVQQGIWRAWRAPLPIVAGVGDVLALPLGGDAELVYVVGGYDLWVRGLPSEHDLTLAEAIRIAERSHM